MKQVTRNNTFETNSSSVHSLCVVGNNKVKVSMLSELKYPIFFGEYDQYYNVYSKPIDIIRYLWTVVNCLEIGNPYRDKMLEWLPNCEFEKSNEISDRRSNYYNIPGYVDHCGSWEYGQLDDNGNSIKGTSMLENVFKNKKSFAEVVFNGQVVTYSDSCDIYKDGDNEIYVEKLVPTNCKKFWVKE